MPIFGERSEAFHEEAVAARVWTEKGNFTISQELEQRQVDGSLPARILLQSDAVTGGRKHFAAANGHQLAALVFASHVIQHGGVVDEGVQLAGGMERRDCSSDSAQIVSPDAANTPTQF